MAGHPAARMRAGTVGLLCVAALLGCSGGSNSGPAEAQGRLEDVDARVLSACTRMGIRLYGEVGRQDGAENLMVSPPSVALALAMAYNGARGETAAAMARTLEVPGMTLDEVNRANALLMAALQRVDPKVQLAVANSLWARQGIPLLPDFVQRCREFYSAQASELDFNDPGAPATINAWVSKSTNGKIPTIVDTIQPDTILFLINAIYFKGAWSKPFDAALTRPGPFTLADGTRKQHPMMRQSGSYPYLRGEGFQAAGLPYGEGRVSMYVFLPDAGASLEAFRQSLTVENWERWLPRFAARDGDIVLPRFTFDYGVSLNDTLKALGMAVAFSREEADFSGITPPPPRAFISQVKHKTFVEVNEQGTEAAAATSVEVGVTSAPLPTERFQMVVDRPFLFAIRHNPTGTVLFLGSVTEPK